MKRLIAAFAAAGLFAAPALATTAKPTAKPAATQAIAKPGKAQHKLAKKGAKTVKPANAKAAG